MCEQGSAAETAKGNDERCHVGLSTPVCCRKKGDWRSDKAAWQRILSFDIILVAS